MKIVHYMFGLPPVRTGGLFRYAIDLATEQQRLGAEVVLLVPGCIRRHSSRVSIHYWRKWNSLSCYRINNPLYIPNSYGIVDPVSFMCPCDKSVYADWLAKVSPDIIHMHSLMGIHAEFLEAAKEAHIPILYTTHDYFGLCPKIDLMNSTRECTECDWSHCSACCTNAYSLKRLRFEQSDLYRMYCSIPFCMAAVHSPLLRKVNFLHPVHGVEASESLPVASAQGDTDFFNLGLYYRRMFADIDFFLFNSKQTKDVFTEKMGYLPGTVLPVLNRAISDHRKKRTFGQTLRLGYLGSSMFQKGFDYLIDELTYVSKTGRTDFKLNTYMIDSANLSFVHNQPQFNPKHIAQVFSGMDLLIVPSLWKETFGMVVIEALSYAVPVVISENVGAKMFIEQLPGSGIIFSLKEGALATELIKLYDQRELLVEMHQNIISSSFNFNFHEHVDAITSQYIKVQKEIRVE